jgi:hypothetical protein
MTAEPWQKELDSIEESLRNPKIITSSELQSLRCKLDELARKLESLDTAVYTVRSYTEIGKKGDVEAPIYAKSKETIINPELLDALKGIVKTGVRETLADFYSKYGGVIEIGRPVVLKQNRDLPQQVIAVESVHTVQPSNVYRSFLNRMNFFGLTPSADTVGFITKKEVGISFFLSFIAALWVLQQTALTALAIAFALYGVTEVLANGPIKGIRKFVKEFTGYAVGFCSIFLVIAVLASKQLFTDTAIEFFESGIIFLFFCLMILIAYNNLRRTVTKLPDIDYWFTVITNKIFKKPKK